MTIRRYTIHPPQLVGRLSDIKTGEDVSKAVGRLVGEYNTAMQELQRFLRYLMDANDTGQTGQGIEGVDEGAVEHGLLRGLDDDDHPQYLKEKLHGGLGIEIPDHTHDETSGGVLPGGSAQGVGLEWNYQGGDPGAGPGYALYDHHHWLYQKRTFGMTLDGGLLTPGFKGYIALPFTGRIMGWDLEADQAGDCVIDVWLAPYRPTALNSICGTVKPHLESESYAQGRADEGGWSVQVRRGDIAAFYVDSVATITRASLRVTVEEEDPWVLPEPTP